VKYACVSMYEWPAGADQAAVELAYPSSANNQATGTREKARAAFYMNVSCRRVDVRSTEMDGKGPYRCDDDGVAVGRPTTHRSSVVVATLL